LGRADLVPFPRPVFGAWALRKEEKLMGWLLILAFVVLAGLGLWRMGKLQRSALELSGAALLLAVAGYALQGSPSLPGSTRAASDDGKGEIAPPEIRKTSASSMSAEDEWLATADALVRAGRVRLAVNMLGEGAKKFPGNPDIWVGLGNALVVHGNGQMNPAAQYAFEKAAKIAPNHPGPPFFLGLTLAQSGKLDEAGEVWRGLLGRAQADAPWKADLEARLAEIGQMPKAAAAK
jgi:cytochrome c-type biogenesis protein CcmH